MRTSKYSPEQIAQALRQAESGTPIVEIRRKLQVTEQTFYRWKKKFGELGTPEIRELRQLREENRKLKQLVADLSLDKTILQDTPAKKMVSPAQRRTWVRWVQDAYAVSERTACDAGGVARSSVRYASVAAPQEPLRQRLRELAQTRVAYGYRRLHVLLCREGWPVNHKRIQRLYRDEGLAQQRTRPKRRRSAVPRVVRQLPGAANERWAMDFIHDQLADGTAFRVLSIVDLYTRECVGLVPAVRLRADDVIAALNRLRDERGIPAVIQCDNGTEFTSIALDHLCYWNQVRLDFSRPGKPTDNAAIESFHNRFRRECLTQHYFIDITDAQESIAQYQSEYNNDRPHSSLGNVPPAHFRATVAITASVSTTA
ncbi:IS3 family transposase [Gemmatimonas sp.]|uniref:IS3 family transposase n=1 Tax=Gemmatimonas sp. TaxID=1962908 RepID=UPI003F6FC32C